MLILTLVQSMYATGGSLLPYYHEITLTSISCVQHSARVGISMNSQREYTADEEMCVYIYIYIYIYSHPWPDCFVISQLFSVARHVGCLKLGLKPAQLYVRLSIRPLSQQAYHISEGIVRWIVNTGICEYRNCEYRICEYRNMNTGIVNTGYVNTGICEYRNCEYRNMKKLDIQRMNLFWVELFAKVKIFQFLYEIIIRAMLICDVPMWIIFMMKWKS